MFCFSWFLGRRKGAKRVEEWTRQQSAAKPEAEQRTYLDNAPYLLPKDAQEDERLKFQHHALHHAFGNHYLAPLSPETRTILDVGSGTGIWAMDMAQQFPHAHIISVDITFSSLPQILPQTCLFAQADILQGLPFPSGQFDFTHQRLLVGAIPAPRWPEVVRELVRVTRPQGWIELLEVGTTVHNAGAATARLLAWVRETSQAQGIEMAMVTQLGNMLQHAGCQAIETQDIPVPLGAWAGRSGEMLKLDAIRVFQAMRPRTTTPAEQLDGMLAEAAEEWERNHAYYVFHAAYGRRASL
ncbi:MAG TPA: methyltransferase domain-containing protein [Ktedonobacteraceae bacterium]|nr:methyltransferase domain-containing protein [Ktedonobacteraceae bacterium]